MGKRYRVVGGLEVCYTPNGEIVTEEDLLAYPANIPALLQGRHLEEVIEDDVPQDTPPVKRRAKAKDGDG
jgi:hypothetical protein